MSLLLEALKKAEKAKEEAQRRAREGEAEATGELRLADDAPPPDERRVMTRDELPPITSPLDIQSEDLAASAAGFAAPELALQQGAPRAAATASRGGEERQAAQRATARKPFEAKMREPNPRLPFYLAVGALGVFAVGVVVYFWIQLRPPAPMFNANPPPPGPEVAVANVQTPTPAPSAASSAPPSGVSAIPGLPSATPPPQPEPPAAQVPNHPAATPGRPAARPVAPAQPAHPAPKAQKSPARSAAAAPAHVVPMAKVAPSRQPPRIHPLVSAGYAAYEAGDLERARADYQQVLREEPANRDAMLGLAAVETRTQHFAAAEMLYRRLLLADPRDPYAQAGLLGLRAPQVDPVSAESRLKGLIADDAGQSVLFFSLGNQYAQQQRWPEAQQAYAKAAGMDADNADYAYNLAVSLEHLRQPQAALEQYRRALTLGLKRTSSFDPAAAQARVQALSR